MVPQGDIQLVVERAQTRAAVDCCKYVRSIFVHAARVTCAVEFDSRGGMRAVGGGVSRISGWYTHPAGIGSQPVIVINCVNRCAERAQFSGAACRNGQHRIYVIGLDGGWVGSCVRMFGAETINHAMIIVGYICLRCCATYSMWNLIFHIDLFWGSLVYGAGLIVLILRYWTKDMCYIGIEKGRICWLLERSKFISKLSIFSISDIVCQLFI